jgi:hypothetical protein
MTAWSAIDSTAIGKALNREFTNKVEGSGRISVDVSAPRGTKFTAEGGGIFKQTEVSRSIQMEPAATSSGEE